MRVLLSLLLALAAATPSALAQDVPPETVVLEVQPFADTVRPLQEPQTTTFTVRVSCVLAEPVGIPIRVSVVGSPTWATLVVSPANAVASTDGCADDGWTQTEGTLIATATDQAPAFRPAPVILEATAGSDLRQASARGQTNVTASYFSILDAALPVSSLTLAPGASTDVPLEVTNFGNGATRVTLDLVTPPDSLRVTMPEPFVLESRQEGSARTSHTFSLAVEAPPEEGFVNRVESFTFRVQGAYAADESLAGDTSTLSVVVTIKQLPTDGAAKALPGPGALLALLGGAIAAAGYLRRQG